jgi:hypothetical protein
MPDSTPHRGMPLLAALALLTASPPGRAAAAQSARPDTRSDTLSDTRVRIAVTGAKRPVAGLLRRVGADSVAVHDSGGRPRAVVARADVRRLEVSRGWESRGAAFRRGALRGALIGAGTGAFGGWFSETCRDRDGNPRTCETEVSRGGQIAGGAAAGAVIGGLIGGFVARPRERWVVAELPARVGFVPFGPRGAAAVATVHF